MVTKISDNKHLTYLVDTLWEYRSMGQFTDMIICCGDGSSNLHKSIMTSVLKTAGLGLLLFQDSDCIILPGVSIFEIESALRDLYYKQDSQPLLQLLCCFMPLAKPESTNTTVKKVEPKKREIRIKEDNININDMLQVQYKPSPVKIEPKPPGFDTPPQKMPIQRLPTRERVIASKKFRIICPHCQMPVVGKKSFERHLRNFHNTTLPREREDVMCQICGKTLKHSKILQTHMKEVHGDKSFTCNLCGLNLSCQRNLSQHMITHTTPSIPCDQCGKLFKRKDAVKSHIKKFHMQVREKKCNQCDKSFADDRHLREHVMAIHDKLKPFGCEICDFKCARIDNLNTHRKKIHGIDNKLTRAQHDTWIVQGKHPYIRCMIGGAEAKHLPHN